MHGMQEGLVAPSWNDPKYKEAILAKGQRRPRKPNSAPVPIEAGSGGLKCTNCGLPVAISAPKHCQCDIWNVGKRPAEG